MMKYRTVIDKVFKNTISESQKHDIDDILVMFEIHDKVGGFA
jgi:hypothetical protein